jgi:hypothetical protein
MNIDLEKYLELNWREVACQRTVSNGNFPLGIQDFDFSVSGSTNAWIPAYTYFRVEATLQMVLGDGTVRAPTLADRTAFALSSPHGLYSNCYFRCGGQDVSTMTSFISQSGALRERIGKSGAWISNVGRNAAYSDPSFTRRCHSVSLDGYYNEDGLQDLTVPNFVSNFTTPTINNQFEALQNGNIADVLSFKDVTNATIPPADVRVVVAEEPYAYAGAVPLTPNGNVLYEATFSTSTAQVFSITLSGLLPGDIIRLAPVLAAQPNYFIIVSITDDTTAVVTSPPISISPSPPSIASGVFSAYRPGIQSNTLAKQNMPNPRCGKNRIFMNFQPSLGIFDLHQGIGSGSFKFQLNPNVNYQTACVETVGRCVPIKPGDAGYNPLVFGAYNVVPLKPAVAGQTTGGVPAKSVVGYQLSIQNVLLYIATIKQPMPMSGILPLSLMETQIMQKTMSSVTAGSSNQLDFTVPPSTLALTVWVQSPQSGTNSSLPPSKFKVAQGTNTPDENLQSIQVTYGSSTKPSTLYLSGYNQVANVVPNANGTYDLSWTGDAASLVQYNSSTSSEMQQRWIQSQQNAGKLGNDGGTENYLNFLDMGPYYHFDFSRDKADTSSYVNVQIQYNEDLPAGTNLYICAWYSRQVEIAFESGVVTSVVSVNR